MLEQLQKRKVFRAVSTYAVACFVLLQILDVLAEPLGVTTQHLQWLVVAMLVGLVATVYLSWAFDLRSSKSPASAGSRVLGASIALVAIGLFGGGIWWVLKPTDAVVSEPSLSTAKTINWQQRSYGAALSVAVLTFNDLSSIVRDKNLAAAISQSVRYQLIQEGSYDVVPTQLSQSNLLPEGVDRVVDGSIRVTDEELLLDIEAFDPKSGKRLITEQLRWPIAASEVMSKQVSTYLIRFLGATLAKGGAFGPSTPAAKRLFQNSLLFFSDDAFSSDAIKALEEIIELEPSWAPGWSLLGTFQVILSVYSSDPSRLEGAHAAYQQALQQGMDRNELELDLAQLAWFRGDLAQTEAQMADAALNQQDPFQSALFMKAVGLLEESHPIVRKQANLWPYNTGGWRRLVESCFALRDPECVLEAEERRKAIVPPNQYVIKSEAVWAHGKKGDLSTLHAIRDDLRARLKGIEKESTTAIKFYSVETQADLEIALLESKTPPELLQKLKAFKKWYSLLRLGEEALAAELAEQSLAERPPQVSMWHWTEERWAVPEEFRDHALVQRFNEATGYTKSLRLEVCRRIQTQFPPESGIQCDLQRYLRESDTKI